MERPSYCVLGGGGLLGSAFIEELSRYGTPSLLAPSRAELDVTNESDVFAYISSYQPQIILNCTGNRDFEWCEKNPNLAFSIHANAVGYLARAAQANRCRLIHFSSDYVFSGEEGYPYSEFDVANPNRVYGSSKLFGEKNALKSGAWVYRIPMVFGPAHLNIVEWICSVIEKRGSAELYSGLMSICSSNWIAQVVLLTLHKDIPSGLYHLAHDDFMSRMDVADVCARHFGYDVRDFFSEGESSGDFRLNNKKLRGQMNLSTLGRCGDDLLYFLDHFKSRSRS